MRRGKYTPSDLVPPDKLKSKNEKRRRTYAAAQIAAGFGYRPQVSTEGLVAVPRQIERFIDVLDSTVKQVKMAIDQDLAKPKSLEEKLKTADEYFQKKAQETKKDEPSHE